jgi:uncharacterized membrane protein
MNGAENPDIIDWKRARSVIEHENTLVNNRVTWLLVSQAFLFAVYGTLLTSWGKAELRIGRETFVLLLLALLVISGYICISIGIVLAAAVKHIKYVHCWWYKLEINSVSTRIIEEATYSLSDRNRLHPYLQGWKARTHTRPFDTEFMPYFFLFGWTILFFVGVIVAYPELWTQVLNALTRILAVVGVIVVAATIAFVAYRYGKRSAGAEDKSTVPQTSQPS